MTISLLSEATVFEPDSVKRQHTNHKMKFPHLAENKDLLQSEVKPISAALPSFNIKLTYCYIMIILL